MQLRLMVVFLFVCVSGDQPAAAQVQLEEAFSGRTFANPVGLEYAREDDSTLYVVERKGTIIAIDQTGEETSTTTFLDIEDQVRLGGELGLLGLAFHPNYDENGYFFVNYTTGDEENRRSRLSRFQHSTEDLTRADPESETVLLTVPQPGDTHNGGDLAFGPDGYLYGSLGDGGPNPNAAQDRTNLLGTFIRIDVDGSSEDRAYAIPPDNPFVDNDQGFREEIYAWGFRNPWRFSFDRNTGNLWVGDVGENQWEEIDTVESGHNYGWPILEGPECYQNDDCDPSEFTAPVYSYDHNAGRSITGGFVYRGDNVPELQGKYVYGDFVFGNVWALTFDDDEPTPEMLSLDANPQPVTFGEDADGELYLVSYGSNGSVFRFTDGQDNPVTQFGQPSSGPQLALAGPHPVSERTTLTFTLPTSGPALLAVYDAASRRVKVLFNGTVSAHTIQRIHFETEKLSAGVYFVRLQTESEITRTQKIVVAR